MVFLVKLEVIPDGAAPGDQPEAFGERLMDAMVEAGVANPGVGADLSTGMTEVTFTVAASSVPDALAEGARMLNTVMWRAGVPR